MRKIQSMLIIFLSLASGAALSYADFYESKTLKDLAVSSMLDTTYLAPRNKGIITVHKATVQQHVLTNKQTAYIDCDVGQPSAMIISEDHQHRRVRKGDAYLERLQPSNNRSSSIGEGEYKLHLTDVKFPALVVTLCASYTTTPSSVDGGSTSARIGWQCSEIEPRLRDPKSRTLPGYSCTSYGRIDLNNK